MIVLHVPAAGVAAGPTQQPPRIYLMDLRASDQTLADSAVTYQSRGDFFVDFPAFLEAVEFQIQKRGRVWSGWFRAEESRFVWNMNNGQVQLIGESATQQRNARWAASDEGSFVLVKQDPQWIETDEGIFVSLKALEAWFNLELTANTRDQTITVVSSEPLPFQQRAARAAARNAFRPGAPAVADMRVPDQYRWATLPLIDLSADYRIQNVAAGARNSSMQTTLTTGLDLMKHSFVYTGSTGGVRGDGRQRLTISRVAATPGATLFLGMDRYVMGDIFATNSNLVNGGGDGSGFRIERRRTGQGSSPNLVTIAGDATPAWEVELYRNGALITFDTVGADGRYIFPNQETVYGENVFLVRLYGPQGQIQEERHVHWGGGIELAKGDYNFSLSHIDFSKRLLDGVRTGVNGLASARTTDVRYSYALTRNFQLGGAYTWARLGSRSADGTFSDSEYATLDGRMDLARGLLLAEVADQQEQGSAWALHYLTSLNGQSLSLSHRSFHDFESPYTVRKTKLDAQNQITLSGPLRIAGLSSYALRFTHQDRADGLSDYRVFNRLGVRWGPAIFSNDLEYFRVPAGESFYLGRLRISGRRNRLSFRGQLDYDPAGARPLNQISGTVAWTLNRRLHNTLTVVKALKNSRDIHVEDTLTIGIGDLNLSLTVNAGSADSWAVGLGINTRFGYDRELTRFITADRSLAHTGRATLNLFLDSNNNGLWEPDETPVEWAAYKNEQVSGSTPGVLRLTGVPADTAVRVQTRHFRFDDPFFSPRHKSYEFYTHAGSDINVNVPVVVIGDVEGYLYPGAGMDDADVRSVQVTLYSSDGQKIAVTRSEFDGYYTFVGIPIGHYEVVVRPYPDKPGYHLQRFSLDPENSHRMLDPIHLWKR